MGEIKWCTHCRRSQIHTALTRSRTHTLTHARTLPLLQTVHFKVHDPKMHCKGGTSRENTVQSRYHGGGHGGGSMGRRGRYDEESGGGSGRTEYGRNHNHNHHPPPMMMAQVLIDDRSIVVSFVTN